MGGALPSRRGLTDVLVEWSDGVVVLCAARQADLGLTRLEACGEGEGWVMPQAALGNENDEKEPLDTRVMRCRRSVDGLRRYRATRKTWER